MASSVQDSSSQQSVFDDIKLFFFDRVAITMMTNETRSLFTQLR